MTTHAPGDSHGHTDPHGEHVHGGHAHGEAHGDHGGVGKYVLVFVALCVLSSASFFTCSKYWDRIFGTDPFSDHVAWAFMMAVSCGKALLVVLFFMHVKYEASWKYVLTIPASIMAIFLGLALVPDIGLRRHHYSQEREYYSAQPAAPLEGGAEPAAH
jgi:cytochrome c oxidase subunit 4